MFSHIEKQQKEKQAHFSLLDSFFRDIFSKKENIQWIFRYEAHTPPIDTIEKVTAFLFDTV